MKGRSPRTALVAGSSVGIFLVVAFAAATADLKSPRPDTVAREGNQRSGNQIELAQVTAPHAGNALGRPPAPRYRIVSSASH
jgi:hypothetical protein